ncbi:hypothetical protein MATL_G00083860 [Megalops atlanticus]|uniref:Uncharacterized protein n=1 Tax=Megalops atlanticus TaxID=7932 RepID=A0A9D3Q3B9_MEGAT|nr:hypothetical protein MATL_G00083860 [Megalops atlanticus]
MKFIPVIIFYDAYYEPPLKDCFCEVVFSSLPVDSSRFGSSGNLSQASSQLSETGQDSAAGSELEERRDPESFHSYHSTGSYRPANGHAAWDEEVLGPSLEPGQAPNGTPQTDRISPVQPPALQEKKAERPLKSFLDDGPPPFSPSRVRWLKAINKVRVQLQECLQNIYSTG